MRRRSLFCPLCGNTAPRPLHADPEREFFLCGTCTLIFADPDSRPMPLEEVVRYAQHENDPSDPDYVAFLRRLADPLLDRVHPDSRGLDFGCGPAPVLGQILTDAGRPTRSYDPVFFPDTSLLDATYDFVTCCEVLEHLHDPAGTLELFERLLGDGGKLAVMTRFHGERPFDEWWYRRDPTHVCFYNEDTMRWIAQRNGWVVEFPALNVAIFSVGSRKQKPAAPR